jgi:hypothetical protein
MTGTGRRHGLEGSWEWLEYAAGLPSKPIALPIGAVGGVVASGRWIVVGGTFINSATTAGTVDVQDGQGGPMQLVSRTQVAASSSATLNLPVRGVLLEIGAFVTYTTVNISGALLLVPLWHYRETAPGE